jgi:hypothetical protein
LIFQSLYYSGKQHDADYAIYLKAYGTAYVFQCLS